jgi:hypothetical protein
MKAFFWQICCCSLMSRHCSTCLIDHAATSQKIFFHSVKENSSTISQSVVQFSEYATNRMSKRM